MRHLAFRGLCTQGDASIEALAADLEFPDGTTAEGVKSFLLETWEPSWSSKAPSRASKQPRRLIYKLQRAMHVEEVWPLEPNNEVTRLRGKETLLTLVHRMFEHGHVPTPERDEDGEYVDELLARRHHGLRKVASLTIQDLRVPPHVLENEAKLERQRQERRQQKQERFTQRRDQMMREWSQRGRDRGKRRSHQNERDRSRDLSHAYYD